MSITQSDPRAYLKVFWRWKLLVIACAVLVPGAAYLITSRQAKVYQSSLLLEEQSLPVDTQLLLTSPAPAASGAPPSAETLGGEARVIATPGVAKLAAPLLNPPPTDPNSLLNQITTTPDTSTGFITVVARAPTPQRAADIANAFGLAVVHLRNKQAEDLVSITIARTQKEIASLPKKDTLSRTQLTTALSSLQALKAAQNANAQVLQEAVPSRSPVSPKPVKATALGLVAGLLLAIAAVFLAEAADRRIRHPEDLEEIAGLPLLSVIPRTSFSKVTAGKHGDEPFHMLRSALMFFNVDRPLSSILIASPAKGDGKTTVATRLSLAAAQTGRHVILVDADLRRPQAASRLGVDVGALEPGHGLAGVLSGQASLLEALVDIPVHDPGQDEVIPSQLQGSLRVLPAGETPPNPSELLASQRMRELIDELREQSDLVVFDTNPLLSVSDSLPLLDSVSGVVLVARLNYTTKDAVRRFQKTIVNTNASVLGVVATGAPTGLGRYGYGYGYGYYGYGYSSKPQANGNGGHKKGLRRRLGRREKVK